MIRIGVVGWGYWGAKLTRNLEQTSGAVLAAICDPSEGRLAQAAEQHPAARGTRELASLCADPAIDAVVIATPAPTHFAITQAALRANKHVLVEKPFTHDPELALGLIEEGERRNLVVMVDHTFLFCPPVLAIGRLLTDGGLGRLQSYQSRRLNAGTVRNDLDVLWDVAPHDLAILDHLLPDRPVAIRVTDVTADVVGRALAACLTLEYAEGCVARIEVSWVAPRKTRQIRLECEGGRLDYDDLDPATPLQLRSSAGTPMPVAVPDGAEPLRRMLDHFVSCIRSGQRPVSDGAMGHRVVRLLEAAGQSRREGGALIQLEPAGIPR